MSGLTWLHLSDWHQKGNEFDRVVLRDALIKDIKERINISPDLAKIDFIVFSGDVAYSGKPDEYQAAKEELLDPLLEATSLSSDKLFIVPGNHDLDRNKFDLLPAPLTKPLKSTKDIQVWLCDTEKRKRLSDPFKAFSSFVSSYTGQKDPEYASVRRMEINGRKIALLGINSSWMCGRKQDDRGLVLIGEPQINDSLNTISDADIKIAVIHHPFDWLSDFDRNKVESRLMRGCDFILRGHQHDPQVTVIRSTLGDCIVIPAGTSYDRRLPPDLRYANAYNFVHLDIENTRRGVVYLHRWSDKRNEWITDEDSIKGGKFEFEMIEKNQSDISIPFVIAAMTHSEATELDTRVIEDKDTRELFKNFKNALQGDIQGYGIDWKSCYGDLRKDWKPAIYKGKSVNNIITEAIHYINHYGCISGGTNCPKIKWIDFSQSFFEGENGMETPLQLYENGGVLIVDSISLFHPVIVERFMKSNVLTSNNIAVLVLSPINFCMIPLNRLIKDLMKKKLGMIIDSDGTESNLGCLNEKVIRDMSVIQRWLFSTLPEVRKKLQISSKQIFEKALQNETKQGKKGFSNVVFHRENHDEL